MPFGDFWPPQTPPPHPPMSTYRPPSEILNTPLLVYHVQPNFVEIFLNVRISFYVDYSYPNAVLFNLTLCWECYAINIFVLANLRWIR